MPSFTQPEGEKNSLKSGIDILELSPVSYEYFDLSVATDDDYLLAIQENYLSTEKFLKKYAWMMNYYHSKFDPIFGKEICIKEELRKEAAQRLGLHLIDIFY